MSDLSRTYAESYRIARAGAGMQTIQSVLRHDNIDLPQTLVSRRYIEYEEDEDAESKT